MPDSRVDTIIDRLRNARSTGIDHRGEVRVPLAVAVAAVHAAAGLGSPDERLREALELIRAHARLDLTERGIAEAERYAVIADDALTGSDLLASSTAEKLASPRKHSASASDPMPLCDCEFCARPLRDHEEETR